MRARINVLSEIPVKWYEAVRRWSRINSSKKTVSGGMEMPDHNDEYLLYQTLLGIWPLVHPDATGYLELLRRVQTYMDKAAKEAKVHTSWINPNQKYDQAMQDFIAAVLEPAEDNLFLQDFREFLSPIASAGIYNSLSQVLLKVASPGVPDFYQGSETWNFSLVDPDNRSPVNFDVLRSQLAAIRDSMAEGRSGLVSEWIRRPEDGRIKLYVTSRSLTYRRDHRELFASGAYIPLDGAGRHKQHVVAFARRRDGKTVIAAAGRFFLKLRPGGELPLGRETWEDTVLQLPKTFRSAAFRDIFTGHRLAVSRRGTQGVLSLAEVFGSLPVALLEDD